MPIHTPAEQLQSFRETARILGTTPPRLRRVCYLLDTRRYDDLDREGLRALSVALLALRPRKEAAYGVAR